MNTIYDYNISTQYVYLYHRHVPNRRSLGHPRLPVPNPTEGLIWPKPCHIELNLIIHEESNITIMNPRVKVVYHTRTFSVTFFHHVHVARINVFVAKGEMTNFDAHGFIFYLNTLTFPGGYQVVPISLGG